ncbi:MAG: DUF4402 domain-containing protein [Pseudomonadota bacterium]
MKDASSLTARGLKSLFGLTALALMAAGASPLMAQSSVATPASAQIQGETRITKLGDLEFGQIVPGASGGSVTVAPDGTASATGTLVLANSGQSAATFELERQILQDFPTYSGPDGTDTIEIVNVNNPAARMTVRDFTTDFNRTIFFGFPAYFFRTTYDFRVGGTLDVAADQEPGQYVGSFTVTIDYN